MRRKLDRGIISEFDMRNKSVVAGYAFMILVLLGAAVTMVYPMLMTIFSAFKTRQEMFVFPPTLLPKTWVWTHFGEAGEYFKLGKYMLNTLQIFVGNGLLGFLFCGMAAYSLSKLKVPLRKWFVLFFMSTLLIPPATYMIPNFLNLKSLGLLNSYWAFWLPAAANAFYLMLLKNFFDGLHKELFEAARIDGASELRCFLQLAVPLSIPVFTTLLIFTFTSVWNDWFWPSLVIQSEAKLPVASAVYKFVLNAARMPLPVKYAIMTMVMAPPVVFFLLFQKNITSSMNLGGVKG